VQFQAVSEPDGLTDGPGVPVQVKVAATPERLGNKIIRYITTELRTSGTPISITNTDPRYRILIHAVETSFPHDIVMAVLFTSVLNLEAITHLDLSDPRIAAMGLTEEQIDSLTELKVGADLHHMALEHGLKFLYSSGRERSIEPYESIVSLRAWSSSADDLSNVIRGLVAEFNESVLEGQKKVEGE
jgi:hypothetical protein